MTESGNIQAAPPIYRTWFVFVIAYLIFDYGRPQDIIPPIGYIRPLMIIIIILSYYLIINGKLRHTFRSGQIKVLWCFIFLLGMYVPFARNNFLAFYTFRNMLLFMPFILSVIVTVNSTDRMRTLVNISVGLMAYVSIYSLFHGGIGSGNYFQDENDVSLYINTWLPFCYFLLFQEKSFKMKLFYTACMLAGLVSIVVSFSRGGFVGLVCMGIVVWLFSSKKVTALIVIVLLSGVVYFSGGDRYLAEMSTVTNTEDNTAKERILSWEASWKIFLDKPWGVGGNNFQVWFPQYQSSELKRGMWGRVAHSLWFTLMPETGVAGIILYLMLLIYNIRDIIFLLKMKTSGNSELAYYKALGASFIASFAGFFASASFLSVLYYPHYWYICAIITASRHLAIEKTAQP